MPGVNHKLFSLFSDQDEVFERLHQGGKSIADLFDDILNCLDGTSFTEPNYEKALSPRLYSGHLCFQAIMHSVKCNPFLAMQIL